MGVIVFLYVLVGFLFTGWVAVGFDDSSQILVVGPLCLLLWPIFVLGLILAWGYFELRSVIRRWQR